MDKLKAETKCLRLALWPLLKVGTITNDAENTESPSKYSLWSKHLSLHKYMSLFDHTLLSCLLPGHPISIQVILAKSSKIIRPLIV